MICTYTNDICTNLVGGVYDIYQPARRCICQNIHLLDPLMCDVIIVYMYIYVYVTYKPRLLGVFDIYTTRVRG